VPCIPSLPRLRSQPCKGRYLRQPLLKRHGRPEGGNWRIGISAHLLSPALHQASDTDRNLPALAKQRAIATGRHVSSRKHAMRQFPQRRDISRVNAQHPPVLYTSSST
jgi:hypothetical protein